jgi:predicted component of type VI protein secretion system
MPYLAYAGEKVRLSGEETVVGSGAQATWRVQNADLAARHFTIKVDSGGGAHVKSCTNGAIVAVDGSPITSEGAELKTGTVILAGSARFVYLANENDAIPRPSSDNVAGAAYVVNEGTRKAYPLARRTITLGRDAGSTILLKDPSASRFHADIRSEAGQYVLYTSSPAGTRVNGTAVDGPTILREGDAIAMGGTELRFTRKTLPDDVAIAQDDEASDEKLSRRSTTMMSSIEDSAPTSGNRKFTAEKMMTPPVIAAVVVVLVLIGWLAMR